MATQERGPKRPTRSGSGGGDSDAPPREAHEERIRRAHDEVEIPPQPRRNYMLALILALIVFAILLGVRVLWDGMGARHGPAALLQEETTPQAPAPSN